MSSDSPYYMPPSSSRRDDDKDRSKGSTSTIHPAVKRESTWRPGATSTTTTRTSSSRANAWASRDDDRDSSPGPSARRNDSRNDSYYEPPDASSRSDRGDSGRDRRDRGFGWRRGRDDNRRDDNRGTWDDYRRRMDKRRDSSPERDRDSRDGRGWKRKEKDDDERRPWGRGKDRSRDRGEQTWSDWRKKTSESRAKSPDDSRDRRRSLSRSRSRSRERSPWPKRRARRSSFSDTESESDNDRRRTPRWRSPTPDGKRRDPPSPDLPSAKRVRDLSPRRRRSLSRGRSSTRSISPPSRRRSTSPRSINGRDRSPDSPPRAYGPKSVSSKWDKGPAEIHASDRDRAPEPRVNRDKVDDRWQPAPRGPREFDQRFGRQPFSQTTNGPVKMRQWGAPAKSPSPSPSSQRTRSPPPSQPATTAVAPPVPAPVAPAAATPVIPPGFRKAPPTGPRQRGPPPTGPANSNGNGKASANTSPHKPASGWRPIQQPPAASSGGFKRAVGQGAQSAVDAPEVDMELEDNVQATSRPLSPKRSDQWNPNKWNPNKWTPAKSDDGPVRAEVYLERLAEKEAQYDKHLSSVAPYVSAAFTQWYGQNQKPPLRDFMVHYLGRRPSGFELDQIHQLLNRRNQLSTDQFELRNLHDRALKEEAAQKEAEAQAVVEPLRLTRARPGEAYERLAQVGEGTYGKVYKARSATSGVFVALKRIRMEQEKDGFPVTSMREIKLLQALHHPNVVRLLEMMVSKGSVYMVLEYMNHDLTGILSHPEVALTPANIKSLNYQMLAGLGYLHRRGILHRDMKGSNILLNGDGELKLADFGLARFYHKHKRGDYTNRVITLWYRSPELLMGETCYGPEVDMWSAGCIALEIFTAKPIFQGSDEINQLQVIYQIMGTPDEETWPGITELPWYELVRPRDIVPSKFRTTFSKWLSPAALDLVGGLLSINPAQRLSADDALEMPYFTEEEPTMERPAQLAACGEHHEMSVKLERHRRREAK